MQIFHIPFLQCKLTISSILVRKKLNDSNNNNNNNNNNNSNDHDNI